MRNRYANLRAAIAPALVVCIICTALRLPAATPAQAADQPVQVSGELKQWHAVTLTFQGPQCSETGRPNPFRDYRLEVIFAREGGSLRVPGYFAADGNAAESSASAGRAWRVHFVPDATGEWRWSASFRTGPDVALSDDPRAGRPTAFDGASGTLSIGPSDKSGRDHRAKGLLRYVGRHYLQFAGTGEFFIKGGADSPENFLACADFDGTYRAGRKEELRPGEANPQGLHRYEPHVRDFRPGDPTWRGGRGKGIIGALNYLSSQGMNSVYFLTMNFGGDGKDVWPWISPDQRDRFDCSKLDQWEIVFSHMDRRGIMLHVITQEQENDQLLDGGALGPLRKLYYRELIARFAHHLAVVWNLGEENTNTTEQRVAFCRYISRLDPYDHPVVVHTFPGKYDQVYGPLLRCPWFYGPSLQMGQMRKTHEETLKWVTRSAGAGRKWIVSLDEIGPAHTGVKPDADDPQHDEVRRYALWGNLMAGGAGCEWYFGYRFADNDLNCEDWRSRQAMWEQTRYAMQFFQQYLPFAEMRPGDELLAGGRGWCLALPGKLCAVYLPEGGSAELRIDSGTYALKWYDPRRGGALLDGSVARLSGPGTRGLGLPPRDRNEDWAVLVERVTGR